MGILKYLFFAFLLSLIVRTGKCMDTKLDQYLNEKLREAKVNIAQNHIQASRKVYVNNYNVSWFNIWSTVWGVDSPVTINTFDKVLLAHRNGTMKISIDVSTSNRASKLQENNRIIQNYSRPIKFVRTTKWKTTLYLLVCYDVSMCSLYTGNDVSSLIRRQNIRHRGSLVDACFFTKTNRLYLILVNNQGHIPTPSVIYHWAGTYMDIITYVMTTSAVSVTTFKYKQSVIIIFAQSVDADPSIVSNVYEFKETGIETIQFLQTFKPILVHHYSCDNNNFVLITNEIKGSSVYWWDGTELLEWIDIPEIKAYYFMQTVYLPDGTYFIVAHNDVVELFKLFSTTDYMSLSTTKLKDERKVVDMQAIVHDGSVKVTLTTLSQEGLYSVESWDLNLKNKTSYGNSKMVTEPSQVCLLDVIKLLETRKPIIDKFQSFWSYPENNLINSDTIKFPNVILESGNVKKIDLYVEDEVLTPAKLRESFDRLDSEFESLSKASMNLLKPNVKNNLYGTINIEGDAFFEEIYIDTIQIDKLNNITYDFRNYMSLKDDQSFELPLQAENITVHDLQVNSLCGIPNQYWAITDDENSKIFISERDDTRELSGNSILVHSSITIPNLIVKKINDTDMDELMEQLFIIGGDQTIKGNIMYDHLEAKNLTTINHNGLSSKLLMTKQSDENFHEFSMKDLEIETLYVDLIDGIPLEKFAMKTRENIIEGKVTINSMEITETLFMDPDSKMSIIPSTQIYDNVEIDGDIVVKKFDFKMNSKLNMDNLEVQPDRIFENVWTKSSDQTIRNDVSLDSGVTVDRLETVFLNGFTKEEFLYTTVDRIPEKFTNLNFENVHVDDVIYTREQNPYNFDVQNGIINIYGDLRVEHLEMNDLKADNYNGVPINLILNNTGDLKVLEDVDLTTILTQRAIVRDLNFHFLNDRSTSSYLKMPIKVNDSLVFRSVNIPEFHAEEIVIESFNGTNISHLMDDIPNEIIIDDNLVLSENLTVDIIDYQSTEFFLQEVAKMDIILPTGIEENLIVTNITMKSLNNFTVDELPSKIFSKTSKQKVPGRFSFHQIRAENLDAKYVNDMETSKLIWIDKPLVFSGDLTFTDLFVDNDINTRSLNDYDVEEIYKSPLTIHSTEIFDLNVDGQVTWLNPNNDIKSLSNLFKKVIRKNRPQEIQGNVTFIEELRVLSYQGNVDGIDEIKEIIQDTAFKNSKKIALNGRKVFNNNVTVNNLKTQEIIDIETINDVNIVRLNESIVNKYQDDLVTGSIVIKDEVSVNKLFFNGTLHGIKQDDLVLSNQVLPNNTYIENLIVLGDISLKSIDNVEFDKFVQDRITLSGDHEISGNVQFQGLVESKGRAIVKNINGVRTSDLVINGLSTTQIISGAKTHTNNVIVNHNVNSFLVNNINIVDEFSNSVLNGENVTINGDIIFESFLDTSRDIIVSGLVNGLNVSKSLTTLDYQQNRIVSNLKENEKFIENILKKEAPIVRSLPSIFSYLEMEDQLKIEVPKINKIDVVSFYSIVKFNMYGEQNGDSCGLPDDCSCPLQYVAEFTKNDCRVWQWNDTFTVRNFHEPNNLFGLDVKTSTVSYNRHCTRNDTNSEFTTISWMTNEKNGKSDVRHSDIKIQGFLKDARAFTNDDQVYVALAIYYDHATKTHYTNSSIYKLNLEDNNLILHQKIPTNGASAIEVFKINDGTYIAIACDGDTIGSLIYKLNLNTFMFDLLRVLPSRSDYVKSLSSDEDHFVMISDINTNALNIYYYDRNSDNFYNYQSFFHDSRINGILTFYNGDIGQSDAYAIVTTEDGQFYIYEYMFAMKFQKKLVHRIDGIRTMIPFDYEERHYIICGTRTNTTIMRIVQQGLH